MSIFSKFSFRKNPADAAVGPNIEQDNNSSSKGNWYADRFEALVVQRNILLFLVVLAFVTSLVCVYVVKQVTLSKSVEAMVIEVEDKSGITNIVNPATDKSWSTNKAINEYFLITYLRARETYNISQYSFNFNTLVRLLSTAQVYSQFKETVTNPSTNPVTRYGANNYTTLQVRSIQHLENTASGDQNVQIRFVVTENAGDKKSYNKIVSILWNYNTMQMNFDDRMVNPLGFQVKFYSVADDVS